MKCVNLDTPRYLHGLYMLQLLNKTFLFQHENKLTFRMYILRMKNKQNVDSLNNSTVYIKTSLNTSRHANMFLHKLQ